MTQTYILLLLIHLGLYMEAYVSEILKKTVYTYLLEGFA